MHDMLKRPNMNMALPPERLQHGVNIYMLPFHRLMGQSTVNIAVPISCQLYTMYEVFSL